MTPDPKPVRRVKARARHDKNAAERWWMDVFTDSNGESVLSGDAAECVHHIVYQQKIRRAGFGEDIRWDRRNGMALTLAEHAAHHNGKRPIRLTELPDAVFGFVTDYGFGEWLDRHYPDSAERAA